MNRGTKIRLNFKSEFRFTLNEFVHATDDCKGQVSVGVFQNEPFYLDPKIAIKMPLILRLHCNKCGSSMIPDEHREDIEKVTVARMLIHDRMLPPVLLKFIREYFGKSQKDISEKLKISDRQYRKFEDQKSGQRIQINDLTLLKLWYLDQLKICDDATFKQIFETVFPSRDVSEFNVFAMTPPEEFVESIRSYASENKIAIVNG